MQGMPAALQACQQAVNLLAYRQVVLFTVRCRGALCV